MAMSSLVGWDTWGRPTVYCHSCYLRVFFFLLFLLFELYVCKDILVISFEISVIIIIIIILVSFSLECEWQQISSDLQNSAQYSDNS